MNAYVLHLRHPVRHFHELEVDAAKALVALLGTASTIALGAWGVEAAVTAIAVLTPLTLFGVLKILRQI